jgi:hypothetical protein
MNSALASAEEEVTGIRIITSDPVAAVAGMGFDLAAGSFAHTASGTSRANTIEEILRIDTTLSMETRIPPTTRNPRC